MGFGLLLDCDGTLVLNAEEIHEATVRTVLFENMRAVGLSPDKRHFERIWTERLGQGIATFYSAFADSLPLKDRTALEFRLSGMGQTFEEIYEDRYCADVAAGKLRLVVREGADEAILWANENGHSVAVVSNAKQRILEATLHATGLRGRIDLIAGIDAVVNAGYLPKPRGGSYIYACDQLGIPPSNCVGFEDSRTGWTSLQEAGVRWSFFCHNGDPLPAPDFVREPSAILRPAGCVFKAVQRVVDNTFRSSGSYPVAEIAMAAPNV